MNIVIIGTGNTASILGRKLKEAGHRILQVYGRDSKEASDLAYELDTESTNYWNVVNRSADLYLLAVSDIAVEEVTRELHLKDQTLVHTAASVSKNVLSNASTHYGVFYPLQSLKKESANIPDIPMIIDAGDESTLHTLEALAGTISDKVFRADDEARMKIHMAAVFCNNFVNHIYSLMEDYCKKEGIDFELLVPLIQETAVRIKDTPPSSVQTGPAVRNDTQTIEKHLKLLAGHPHLKKLYEVLTESILSNRSK
jgi:predicted short-subunit dehydrogenase-like oxidoreductase (DUF2520 family)